MRSEGQKGADRRKYSIGKFALLLLDAQTVQVGQITEKREEMITLKMYQSRGYKVSATECGETQIHYSNLIPGDFILTGSRNIPSVIQKLIKEGNYKLW